MRGSLGALTVTINIEIMQQPDVQKLADLHAACFAQGWDADAMRALLAIPGTSAFVASADMGFGLLRTISGEAEILTLAVAEASRGQGVARAIVAAMLEWARENAVKVIFLEVRDSNLAAQKLYLAAGFAILSRRKQYYRAADGTQEDALVMRYEA